MDLDSLFLDFDEGTFTQSFSEEFNGKFPLLSNIEFSLKAAIKHYYSEIFKLDFDIKIFSFNAKNTTLKEISSEGFLIKNFKFELLCNKKIEVGDEYINEIKFKKGKNFQYIKDEYSGTWIDAYIQTYKNKEKNQH